MNNSYNFIVIKIISSRQFIQNIFSCWYHRYIIITSNTLQRSRRDKSINQQ